MRQTPPFRADHVGSLIRPVALREARQAWMAGTLPLDGLREVEDAAIREAIAMQQRVGLRAITDGEYRRVSWRDGFFESVDGFSETREEASFAFTLPDGSTRKAAPVPSVIGKLRRRRGIVTDEFAFVAAATSQFAKATLPSPTVMHFFRGDAVVDPAIYASTEAYMADVSAIYRDEIKALDALGCRYLQIDEVALPILCDERNRDIVRARGESAEAVIGLYVEAINNALADRPPGMTVCLHMCRGNVGEGIASGGYEPIAETVFGALDVDGYFLEFDTPRAGDFTPLRHIPKDKIVALGLMSTKTAALEPADALARRVEEAGKVVDIDRLCLCPQCGFASGFMTDRLTLEEQERKLAHLVETAERIWGR